MARLLLAVDLLTAVVAGLSVTPPHTDLDGDVSAA